MSVIDTLIFDRTQSDVTNDTDKAYIDYKDLNRIEEAVEYLSNLLNYYNYRNNVSIKKDWNISEFRKQEEVDRIKRNYEILKENYAYKFDVPYFEWEDINNANDIEKILFDINKFINNMIAVFRYTNTFYSGETEGLI